MTETNIEQGVVVYEDVQDARTGEIVPKGSPPELRPGILAQINVNQVGTLEVGDDALKVLTESLDPNDVRIRPDGLVYLPWTWYNKRLNRAFGVLKWGQIPQGSPMFTEQGNSVLVVWLNWLVIKGVPVSMAGGEMSYSPSNFTMSKGDAIEGAKSNALARNCKNLGMALELWDAEWVEAWKKQYAETYKNDKGKTLWRKKGNGHKVEKTEPTKATEPAKTEQPAAVGEAVKTDEKHPVSYFRKLDTVRMLGKSAGKKDSEVAAVINQLDQKGSYSIVEVVGKLNGGQNA